MAIATSDDREPTERTLAAFGLTRAIDAVVCADDGIPVKPAPDMVLTLCAETGVAPARTAVVGNSAADLLMARAAGVGLAIGVLTGVGGRTDLAPHADHVIDSVEESPGRLAQPGRDAGWYRWPIAASSQTPYRHLTASPRIRGRVLNGGVASHLARNDPAARPPAAG